MNASPPAPLPRASSLQSQRGSAVLAFVDSLRRVQQSIISPDPLTPGKVTCSGNVFASLQAVIHAYSTPVRAADGSSGSALLTDPIPPADRSVTLQRMQDDGAWLLAAFQPSSGFDVACERRPRESSHPSLDPTLVSCKRCTATLCFRGTGRGAPIIATVFLISCRSGTLHPLTL
jgi:hypothetical protein